MKLFNRFDTAIHHEQVRALYQQTPFLLVGVMLVIIVVATFFWGKVEQQVIVSWLSANITLTIARVALVKSFHRIQPEGSALVKWGIAFAVSSALSGIIWGSIALLFLQPSEVESVLLVAIVLTGMCAGSLVPLSTFIPAYYGFCLPALIPLMFIMLGQEAGVFVLIGYLVLGFIVVNLGYSFVVNRNLAESIRLRFENLELLEGLQLQKDIAEKANTDKSRFLAATSHDLRQPLHAMDLYLGALGNLLTNDEQKTLLKKSRLSSATLAGLLEALMDVSKLDAGEVAVNRTDIDVNALLTEIYDEYNERVTLSGMELQIHSQILYANTDAMLLGRVLRNILSNALHHSHAKIISISAKQVRDGVRIEVSDDGCGIPVSEHEKVFSEFYQLNNPERDRNKGLGLGLAIVKRLMFLLQHELIFKSEQDNGCSFSLVLPPVEMIPVQINEAGADKTPDVSGLFIILIEDEINVREATCALLKQRGCELLVADNLENLKHELNLLSYPSPDLIIADYRLRKNATGLDAILELRNRYNADIPAIVISGDTAREIAEKVQKKNCTLLNKPVLPEKLVATILKTTSSGITDPE